MNRFSFRLAALAAGALLVGVAGGRQPTETKASQKSGDVLVGVLRVHPKFHYRYYIDGFGDGQECALFRADQRLRQIRPGSLIRVRGDLASRFFGDPKDKRAALASTWIIYMDVDDVEVVRGATKAAR